MAPTSSDAVGSSSTKTSGPIAHTEAMATIWRWPPESARMSRSRRCSMPSRAKAPSTRRCISARESPRFSQPNATSEVVSRLKNWLRGFWNTEPTRRHSASISHDLAGAGVGEARPVERKRRVGLRAHAITPSLMSATHATTAPNRAANRASAGPKRSS